MAIILPAKIRETALPISDIGWAGNKSGQPEQRARWRVLRVHAKLSFCCDRLPCDRLPLHGCDRLPLQDCNGSHAAHYKVGKQSNYMAATGSRYMTGDGDGCGILGVLVFVCVSFVCVWERPTGICLRHQGRLNRTCWYTHITHNTDQSSLMYTHITHNANTLESVPNNDSLMTF